MLEINKEDKKTAQEVPVQEQYVVTISLDTEILIKKINKLCNLISEVEKDLISTPLNINIV